MASGRPEKSQFVCSDSARHGAAPGSSAFMFSQATAFGVACGIYDIVKRRSFRVWDLQAIAVHIHNLQELRANASLVEASAVRSFSAKLDRLAVGSILRSKLVFLNRIQLQDVCRA